MKKKKNKPKPTKASYLLSVLGFFKKRSAFLYSRERERFKYSPPKDGHENSGGT